jgi:hypothetical protein
MLCEDESQIPELDHSRPQRRSPPLSALQSQPFAPGLVGTFQDSGGAGRLKWPPCPYHVTPAREFARHNRAQCCPIFVTVSSERQSPRH